MDLLLEAASLRQEGSESSNTISADEMMSGVIDQDDSDNDDGCSCENKPKTKRQHTNDEQEEEDSDDMKKQSSDLHNENERKRRKSMKYAVSTLRQQLTNKPRKSAVNTVLQAAYDEIQDLKSEEKDKAEIVEELKRKHTVLKYLLEKTINELKPNGGTCLSPLVENHTCAAALKHSTSVQTNNNRAGYHWPTTCIPYHPQLPSNITMAAIQQSQTYMTPLAHQLPTASPPSLFPFPYHSPPITIRSPSFFPPIPYLPATTPFTMSPVYYPPPVLLSSGNYPLTNNFVTTPNLITNIRPPTKRSSFDKQLLKGRDKSKSGQHCGSSHLVSDESKRMGIPNTSSEDDFQEHTITVVNGYNSSYRESVIADNRQTKSQTTDDNL